MYKLSSISRGRCDIRSFLKGENMLKIHDTDFDGYSDCPKRAVAKMIQRGLPDARLKDVSTISPSAVVSIAVSAASRAYVKDIINGKKQDFPLQENDIVFVPGTIF